MLEGKELEGKIGSIGSYSVDISDTGMLAASVGLNIDLLAELAKLAKKTGTKIDDTVVQALMKLFGRTEAEIVAAFA